MTQSCTFFAATTGPAFALLDDSEAAPHNPTSRLYTGWQASLVCADPATLPDWQAQLQAALAAGWHAVLVADYEWGLHLQGVAQPAAPACLRVELFDSLQLLAKPAVDAWLDAQVQSLDWPEAGLLDWHSSVNEAQFAAAIEAVHAAIEAGDTYQINYTFAWHGRSYGSPLALFRTLRMRQPAQYGALIRLPEQAAQQAWIVSHSPELFLRVRAGDITARPMKGTAPVQATEAQTAAMAQWLHSDPKNRAENVMIVDLLRNDLGAVAQVGSVHVSELFAVQRNGQVLGMTSTVQAKLRPDAGLAKVLSATFPCGSITGAPKRKTMELIAQIEGVPSQQAHGQDVAHAPHHVVHRRGVYTGAIGWVDRAEPGETGGQERAAIAPFEEPAPALALNYCLSVPIRTLLIDVPLQAEATSLPKPGHAVQLSVGAGIVWDSEASQEWRECQLKARFALENTAGFELFETMHLPAGAAEPAYWDWHVERLLNSAKMLGFQHDWRAWRAQARSYLQQHIEPQAVGDWRVRMALRSDGALSFSHGLLAPVPVDADGCVGVLLADRICHTPVWLRQHKTSLRSDYDAAMRMAEAEGAFDSLFFNEQGHLTEGARSNVFVKLTADPAAPWWTPPLSDGALPGVMRRVLLESGQWNTQERSLTRNDLLGAHALVVCNALRGALRARLWRS